MKGHNLFGGWLYIRFGGPFNRFTFHAGRFSVAWARKRVKW